MMCVDVLLFTCWLILVELFYHYDAVLIYNCKQDCDGVSICLSPLLTTTYFNFS